LFMSLCKSGLIAGSCLVDALVAICIGILSVGILALRRFVLVCGGEFPGAVVGPWFVLCL
jgi:hypothetical protein